MRTSLWFLLGVGLSLGFVQPADAAPLPSALIDACVLAAATPDSMLSACCHPINYECFMFTEEQCQEIDGLWFEGETCDPNP